MTKRPKQFKPKTFKSGKKFERNDAKRNSSKAGYDSQWTKYRFRFLFHNPFCYVCSLQATVVDHIQAHKGDMEKFKDVKNHMPLCKSCHDYVTGKFDREATPKTKEKLEFISRQRDIRGNNSRIKVLPGYVKSR